MSWLWRKIFDRGGESCTQHPERISEVSLTEDPEKGLQNLQKRTNVTKQKESEEEHKKLCFKIARRVHYNELDSLKKLMSTLNQSEQQKILMTKIHKIKVRGKDKFIAFKQSILCHALQKSNIQICEYLINLINDFDVFRTITDVSSFSPLHCAVINHDSRVFEILFNRAKDRYIEKPEKLKEIIDFQSEYANTLLHFACRYGRPGNVKMLLEKGASFNVPNRFKEYPIHWAAFGGHAESVELIFKKYEEEDLKKYADELEECMERVEKEWEKEGRKFNSEADKIDQIHQEAKKRVALQINSNFGEGCFKLEGTYKMWLSPNSVHLAKRQEYQRKRCTLQMYVFQQSTRSRCDL